ncbi:MAG: MBL fold metallo-hydrolase [Planctomycetota bacterium]
MDSLLRGIQNVYRDLGCPGFGHSYLLKRPAGNVLLPRLAGQATIDHEQDAIAAAGGVSLIVVTDYHFAGRSCAAVADFFGAPIVTSAIEKPKLKKKGLSDVTGLAYERHFLEEDLEVIPLPGHTSGGLGLIWKNGATRYLFTGDFLYFDGHTWIAGAKTKRKIQPSLELIKTLPFDVLVGCGSDGVDRPYARLKTSQAKAEFIDQILDAFQK